MSDKIESLIVDTWENKEETNYKLDKKCRSSTNFVLEKAVRLSARKEAKRIVTDKF